MQSVKISSFVCSITCLSCCVQLFNLRYVNCKGDEAVSEIKSPDELICSPVNDIFWNI